VPNRITFRVAGIFLSKACPIMDTVIDSALRRYKISLITSPEKMCRIAGGYSGRAGGYSV